MDAHAGANYLLVKLWKWRMDLCVRFANCKVLHLQIV